MRVSKIRNSPRIVLSAAKNKSELVQDELLLTDTNSDGFSDNYIVSDYLDGELDDGGQRIFAEELAEAEEFLFTPETNTVSTDVVNIEKVEAGIMDAGSGRTPDMKIYGTTLVNLLGSYGNFETDSNADGLADGWSPIHCTYSLSSGEQTFTAESAEAEHYIYKTFYDSRVCAYHTYFTFAYFKTVSSDAVGALAIFSRLPSGTYESFTENSGGSASFELVSKKFTLSELNPTPALIFRLYVRNSLGTAVYTGAGETITVKQAMLIDLTAAGALDPVRAAKYEVDNWEDLTEEQLEAEISYFDSVMSVNVEDGTASELTVENRGKNIIDIERLKDEINNIQPAWGTSLEYKEGRYVLKVTDYSTSTNAFKNTFKPNTQYTFSYWLYYEGSVYGLTLHIKYTDGTTDSLHSSSYNNSLNAWKKQTVVSGAGKTIEYIYRSFGTSATPTYYSEFQVEEGSTATDYVPSRTDSTTIPNTCELHGYSGVFNHIDSNGNYIKNWERADKTTDVSGAFTLSGYASGSKVICRNKTNGEVEVLDAAVSVTTSWTEEDIEILYQLEVPTLTSESLTGAIKLYQGQNNVLSPDSSVPVAINVVNLNNDVTTSTNIVNIENITNTASYEWNSGSLTSWSMSGRSFINLLHDSEAVPDTYSRHFKSLDGNTYFDYLNETLITGDNTYTFVTNSSGDTASMAVYNLTDLGSLTTLEASAANTLAEESLYDTDTLWEDLPEAILTEMLPPYIAQYTKEYTTSYIKPISNTVEHHEIPIDLPLLGLKSYNNVINSDGTGTEYAKISDLSEGSFIYLDEVDDIDYVEIELDYDLSQELEIPEIGVCWDYSSDVSTLTRRVIDTVVEVVWDYSSDVSTLSRRAI